MIEKIAVLGAGQMGNGIAHVAALAGCQVELIDISEGQLQKAEAAITANLDRQLKKILLPSLNGKMRKPIFLIRQS